MTQYVDGDEINVQAIVAGVATGIARKYAGYMEWDDAHQECWAWWYNPDTAKRREVEALITKGETRTAAFRIQREMWKLCEREARKAKAAWSGYSTTDEYFYSERAITMALPAVLHADSEIGPMDEGATTKRKPGEITARTDPAEGGGWLAIYADIASAWEKAKLSKREREALILLHRDQLTQREAGDALGVDQGTVSRSARSGLRKLSEALGGASPWDRTDGLDEALRRRPGVSSGWSGMGQEVTG